MKQSELAARIVESVTDKSFAEVLAPLEIERQRSADHEFRLAFAASVPGGPVRLLDIGARGGPHQRIAALAAAYDVTLCEPEPDEAARLRQSGYRVIEQVIADLPGARRTFHVTANPCNSSLLRPNPAVVLMYAGGMEKFEVVRDVPVAVTTVDAECERLGLQFEEMKVDVQGAEMLVLKGMTACRPFLIELEVSHVEMYVGQPLVFEIGRHLYDIGYICSELHMRRRTGFAVGVRLPHGRRRSRGLPMQGDAQYMPDWTRPEGRALIDHDPLRWAAVLIPVHLDRFVGFVILYGPTTRCGRFSDAT